MDSEIRAIMAQYMPLDNQAETATHGPYANIWEAAFAAAISVRGINAFASLIDSLFQCKWSPCKYVFM